MSIFKSTKIKDATTALEAEVCARTQTPVGNALQVQIGPGDIISNLPVVMNYDHHQTHEGETFRYGNYTASLGNNASKDFRLVVPNIAGITDTPSAVRKCPHLRFEIVSSLGGVGYLYEAPTTTGNGTQRTPISTERNGTYTPNLQIWEDPTVTGVGTQLIVLLNTTSKQTTGGIDSSSFETVLKNNTVYLIRFTSSAASNQVLVRMIWYEDLGV